jgi:hypothetical protein
MSSPAKEDFQIENQRLKLQVQQYEMHLKQKTPQNELIKQLSQQLRDSTSVIKTQQSQLT